MQLGVILVAFTMQACQRGAPQLSTLWLSLHLMIIKVLGFGLLKTVHPDP